jgi:hypothetical protein
LLILFFGVGPYVFRGLLPTEGLDIVKVLLPLFMGYIGLIVGYYFGNKEE